MQKKSWIPTPIKLDRAPVKVAPIKRTPKMRGFMITRVILVLGIRIMWLRVTGKSTSEKVAILLRGALEQLGGLWVKVGQLLAMRRDIFGSEAAGHLGRLQDSATGFSWAHSKRTLEDELGRPVEELFAEIEEDPFSAASIGQIHRAYTHEGTMVAVKVQRPDVEAIMTSDIRFIRLLVMICVRLDFAPFFRWNDFYYEVQKTLTEELDYRFEATYLRLMRKNLKRHEKMYVPKTFLKLSGQRVLTMEFVQGALMADFLRLHSQDPKAADRWCQENGINKKKIARRLISSLLRQQYEDNMFHGDLHPGNIVLLRDNRVCLIDFGAVGRYEKNFLRKYGMMQEALTSGSFTKAADLFLQAMPDLPPIDLERVKLELAESMRNWQLKAEIDTIPYEEKSLAAGFGDMGLIITRYRIPMAWQFLRGDRASYTLDISMRDLFPDMDYFKILRRHQKEAMARRKKMVRNPKALAGHGSRLIIDAATLVQQAQEEGLYEVEWLRRRARIFRAGPSKIAYLVMLIINVASVAGAVGAFYLLGLYLHQQHQTNLGEFFQPMYETTPQLPGEIWVLIGIMLALVARQLFQLMARFKQPEVDLPGGG